MLELRQKWEPLFSNYIREHSASDVIVRDLHRIDQYPNHSTEGRGISPWFKVGLMGTYHRGVLAGLSWGTLTRHGTGDHWRFTDRTAGEDGDIKVLLAGRIPYENIQGVSWDGDEFHRTPHIYCHFGGKPKQPYEDLVFLQRVEFNSGTENYLEVAMYEDVKARTKRSGIRASFYD